MTSVPKSCLLCGATSCDCDLRKHFFVNPGSEVVRSDSREKKSIWSWGLNDYFLFDVFGEEETIPYPRNNGFLSVKTLISGPMNAAIITKEGEYLSWGCNENGQLCHEGTKPGKVKFPAKVVGGSIGSTHFTVLLSNGDLYAWGAFRDYDGTIGFMAKDESDELIKRQTEPVIVAQNVTSVVSGDDHVIFSKGNEIWAWGSNEFGQLGLNFACAKTPERRKEGVTRPQLVFKTNTSRPRIVAGAALSCILDGDATYFSGRACANELGGSINEMIMTFRNIPALSGVKRIAIGRFHVLVLFRDGRVCMSGKAQSLGVDKSTEDFIEIPELRTKIKSVFAGPTTCAAVTKEGKMYLWGDNSAMQIFPENTEETRLKPHVLNPAFIRKHRVVQYGGGSMHSIILAKGPVEPGEPVLQRKKRRHSEISGGVKDEQDVGKQ